MQTETMALRLAADGLRATADQVTAWQQHLRRASGIELSLSDHELGWAVDSALDGWCRVAGGLVDVTRQLAQLLVDGAQEYEGNEASLVALARLVGGGTTGPRPAGGVGVVLAGPTR